MEADVLEQSQEVCKLKKAKNQLQKEQASLLETVSRLQKTKERLSCSITHNGDELQIIEQHSAPYKRNVVTSTLASSSIQSTNVAPTAESAVPGCSTPLRLMQFKLNRKHNMEFDMVLHDTAKQEPHPHEMEGDNFFESDVSGDTEVDEIDTRTPNPRQHIRSTRRKLNSVADEVVSVTATSTVQFLRDMAIQDPQVFICRTFSNSG